MIGWSVHMFSWKCTILQWTVLTSVTRQRWTHTAVNFLSFCHGHSSMGFVFGIFVSDVLPGVQWNPWVWKVSLFAVTESLCWRSICTLQHSTKFKQWLPPCYLRGVNTRSVKSSRFQMLPDTKAVERRKSHASSLTVPHILFFFFFI